MVDRDARTPGDGRIRVGGSSHWREFSIPLGSVPRLSARPEVSLSSPFAARPWRLGCLTRGETRRLRPVTSQPALRVRTPGELLAEKPSFFESDVLSLQAARLLTSANMIQQCDDRVKERLHRHKAF